MFVLSQIGDMAKAAESSYGPYAFGLFSVMVLISAAMILYSKIVKPMQDTAVKVAIEQTKQTENLKATSAHTESSLAIATEIGKQNEAARELLHKMIEKV